MESLPIIPQTAQLLQLITQFFSTQRNAADIMKNMNNVQQICEDIDRFVTKLQSRMMEISQEQERALADAQKRNDIQPNAELDMNNLISRFDKEYAIVENEYQEKRSALDREYSQRKIALETTFNDDLEQIHTRAEYLQSACQQDEASTRLRSNARKLQQNLFNNGWLSLRSRIEAFGVSTKTIKDSSDLLDSPQLLLTLKQDLANGSEAATTSSTPKVSPRPDEQAIQTPIGHQSTLPKRPDLGPDQSQVVVDQGLTIKGKAEEISQPKSALATKVNSQHDEQAFQPQAWNQSALPKAIINPLRIRADQSLTVETQKVIETSDPKSASNTSSETVGKNVNGSLGTPTNVERSLKRKMDDRGDDPKEQISPPKRQRDDRGGVVHASREHLIERGGQSGPSREHSPSKSDFPARDPFPAPRGPLSREQRRKTPTSPRRSSIDDSRQDRRSSFDTPRHDTRREYLPTRSTPTIKEQNQTIWTTPINPNIIRCAYVCILKEHVPVTREILAEMKERFGNQNNHVTHVLADSVGYYILFDGNWGEHDATKFCDIFRGKELKGGHKLVMSRPITALSWDSYKPSSRQSGRGL